MVIEQVKGEMMDKDKVGVIIIIVAFVLLLGIIMYLIVDNTNTSRDTIKTQTEIKNAILDIEMRRLTNESLSSSTNGQYRNGTQTILLFTLKDSSLKETEDVFYHELGHKVWYVYMTDAERLKYEYLFNTTNSFVSDYAKTSLTESFAEDYMFYRTNRTILKEKELLIEKYK